MEGKGTFVGSKERQLVKLVGDHGPSSEVTPRSKRKEQRRYRERIRCQRSDGVELTYRPDPNRVGDRTTTLRRLFIGVGRKI